MNALRTISPAGFCRLDPALRGDVRRRSAPRTLIAGCAVLIAASAIYGASFGFWRAPEQMLYSAIKMPLLLLAVTAVSAGVNAMLAQVIGLDISRRQTTLIIVIGFAITATILAALSPIFFFLAASLPPPGATGDLATYRGLLSLHTLAVAFAGFAGYARVYCLLRDLAARPLARRVLAAWIFVSGLAGSELSWVFTPMLARPDIEIPFLNPNAFRMNMYEYLWQQWHRAGNFQSLENDGTTTSNDWKKSPERSR